MQRKAVREKKKLAKLAKEAAFKESVDRAASDKVDAILGRKLRAFEEKLNVLVNELFTETKEVTSKISDNAKAEVKVEVEKCVERAYARIDLQAERAKAYVPSHEKLEAQIAEHLKKVFSGWAPTQLTKALSDVNFLKAIAEQLRSLQA